jgi:peptidoglycan hydrolase-like protein with peptidoglycan-binding domain
MVAASALDAVAPPMASLSCKEIDYSDEMGSAPDPERATPGPSVGLDFREMYRIIREVASVDSGADGYAAVTPDAGPTARGSTTSGGRQFGLGFGLVLFTQASGHLGSVLRLMQARDPSTFTDVFGPDADALIATTTAPTEGARLQPVGGVPLSDATWVDRFRRAGTVPVFQAAQNEEAIEAQFRPMLDVAFGLGFCTDRALAMVYDRVVTRGLGTGLRWIVETAGPLRTGAQRQHALDVLGFDDLSDFQGVVGWTPQDGVFGPETHAALVGALRRQGDVPTPDPVALCATLIAAAEGPARARLTRLRDSTAFTDAVYRSV